MHDSMVGEEVPAIRYMVVSVDTFSRILVVGAIVCAVPATLAAMYYLVFMAANVRPEKRFIVQFIAPIAIFFPHFWTEVGNTYRKRFLLSVLVFGVFACVAFISKSMID